MARESSLASLKRISDRLVAAALVALGLASALLAFNALAAVRVDVGDSQVAAAERFQPMPTEMLPLEGLLAKTAGRHLIKPTQVQAAVKDSGAAARLVKKLKLQGVVQLGADRLAYIQVEKQGTNAVRSGEKVLEFVVSKIEPGKVTLSLDGVDVELRH